MLPEKADHASNEYEPIKRAFDVLKDGAEEVSKSLVDIAVNGKSEMARMYAAQAVLDRIGLPAKVDVGVTAVHLHGGIDGGPAGTAVDAVANRLKMLGEQHRQILGQDAGADGERAPEREGVVLRFPGGDIEGEVVEDVDADPEE